MSSTQEDTADKADHILNGQSNWVRWFPGLRADARANKTWALFEGTEQILKKPIRSEYVTRPVLASDPITRQEKTPQAELEELVVREAQHRDFKQGIEWYKLDLYEYEEQDARVCRALKMLNDRVDPCMRHDIENHTDPKAALDHLESLYKMQDSCAIQFTYGQINALKLRNCPSMSDYLRSSTKSLRACQKYTRFGLNATTTSWPTRTQLSRPYTPS